MEKKALTVHCSFDEHGPALQDLISKSFKGYVKTELHIFANLPKDVLS